VNTAYDYSHQYEVKICRNVWRGPERRDNGIPCLRDRDGPNIKNSEL